MAISIHCMTGAALTGISHSLAEQDGTHKNRSPTMDIPCNVTKTENASFVLCSMDAVGTIKLLSIVKPFTLCMTCVTVVPQAKSLLKFVEAISEKTLRSTVTQTAARGCGKSLGTWLGTVCRCCFQVGRALSAL